MRFALLAPSVILLAGFVHAQDDTLTVRLRHSACEAVITMKDMRSLTPRSATIKAHDGEEATYAGTWLKDVLRMRCGSIEAMDKRTMVRSYVRVVAADGYSALIALTEADSSFRERPVLLAWKKNGKALDAHDGPLQLIIPDDLRHARDVRQVALLEVVTP